MKKILLSLFVFSFFAVGVSQAQASVLGDLIDQINNLRSKMTASVINSTTQVSIAGTPTTDTTPRIMYWSGKVNQHVDSKTGQWETDPDGVSGANINKLTYCKKWYPNTVEVDDYKNETINTWRAAGNIGEYPSTKMSYECVQKETSPVPTIPPSSVTCPNGAVNYPDCTISAHRTCINGATNPPLCTLIPTNTPSITVLSPNGGNTYTAGEQIKIEWKALNVPDDSVATIALVDKTGNNYYLNSNMMCTSTSPCINIHNGYYTTTIPKTLSSGQYKARVICNVSGSDRACVDSNWEDLSDNYFTILPTTSPTITVLSPNGGEIFKAGDEITVEWETENSNNRVIGFDLVGSKDDSNANTFLITKSQLVNDGQEKVLIPINTPNGNYYRFRIASYDMTASPLSLYDNKVDYSNKSFTITSSIPTSTPDSCTDSDSTAQFYQKGKLTVVKDGVTKTYYDSSPTNRTVLEYYCDGKNVANVTFTCNEWYDSYDGACHRNDKKDEGEKYVTVTYPNEEVSFNEGQKINVTWTSNKLTSSDRLDIYLYVYNSDGTSQLPYLLAQSVPNAGSKEIILPTIGELAAKGIVFADYGKHFKIHIGGSCLNSDGADKSNNYFSINKVSSNTTPTTCLNGICPLWPQCSDAIDNDLDGAIDRNDNNCHFGLDYYNTYMSNFDSENSDELSKIRVLKLTNPRMIGDDVKVLQKYLGIGADGIYGSNTYNAVKNWQMRNNLIIDGVFGPACYNQMYLELFKLKNSL